MNVKNDICVIRDSLLDWLREHRHGVMGTVIFHLVLAIFLVCVGISRLDSQQRMEIEIDMPEPEIVQQKQEEQEKKEQILRQSADEEVNEMLRSLAVNEDVVKKNAEPPPQSISNKFRKKLIVITEGVTGRIKTSITRRIVFEPSEIRRNGCWIHFNPRYTWGKVAYRII